MEGFLLRGEQSFQREQRWFAAIRNVSITWGICIALCILGFVNIWWLWLLLIPALLWLVILADGYAENRRINLSRVVFMDDCIRVLDHKNRCWRIIDYADIKHIDISEWNCISANRYQRKAALGKHIIIFLQDNAKFPFDFEFREPQERLECYYEKDAYFPFYYTPEALQKLYWHMARYYVHLQEGR